MVLTYLYLKLRQTSLVTERVDKYFIGLLLLLSSLLTMLLYTDVHLYDLYGFHINSFVINLVLTPGGIESMGGSSQTYITAGLVTTGLFLIHCLLLLAALYLQAHLRIEKRRLILVFSMFATLSLTERTLYGISDIDQFSPVLSSASTVPLYNHVTFRSLAQKLGIDAATRNDIKMQESVRELNYPLAPINTALKAAPFNIIWLVAESLRWDMLSPDIMPATILESGKGQRSTQHYSGGNGTRQGLFSLFYGIYGAYWNSFLTARQPPLIVDLLQQNDYRLEMFTSADFTYPEFDQTLFANLPGTSLHQLENNIPPHQRDVINTDKITTFLKSRDTSKPFMVFMFYESTHARYDFPEDSAIRVPYLEDLNYTTMTRKSLAPRIEELKNRYINASHHVDTQLEKVYAALTEQSLWENTIVLVTGDHGEEFMENGFWGHNSGFSEQQIRTPMVLWVPNVKPTIVDTPTSHMDVVPTILPLLGVMSPTKDYSLGHNMFESNASREIVVSDWSGVAFVNDEYKFTLPFDSSLSSTNQLYTRDDKPSSDFVDFLKHNKENLDVVLANSRRFLAD
jgi:membrane-anchored protein YejM (alkaline phosphatase superfamily)